MKRQKSIAEYNELVKPHDIREMKTQLLDIILCLQTIDRKHDALPHLFNAVKVLVAIKGARHTLYTQDMNLK